jgi:hypothetical protein
LSGANACVFPTIRSPRAVDESCGKGKAQGFNARCLRLKFTKKGRSLKDLPFFTIERGAV